MLHDISGLLEKIGGKTRLIPDGWVVGSRGSVLSLWKCLCFGPQLFNVSYLFDGLKWLSKLYKYDVGVQISAKLVE